MSEHGTNLWEPLALRFTVFNLSSVPDGRDLYKELVGEAADTEQSRPRYAFKARTGTLDGYQLDVIATPIRIDVIWTPSIKEISDLGELASQSTILTLGK